MRLGLENYKGNQKYPFFWNVWQSVRGNRIPRNKGQEKREPGMTRSIRPGKGERFSLVVAQFYTVVVSMISFRITSWSCVAATGSWWWWSYPWVPESKGEVWCDPIVAVHSESRIIFFSTSKLPLPPGNHELEFDLLPIIHELGTFTWVCLPGPPLFSFYWWTHLRFLSLANPSLFVFGVERRMLQEGAPTTSVPSLLRSAGGMLPCV